MNSKTQVLQSCVKQTHRNLVHYEQRLNHLLQQKSEGKTYIGKDGTDLLAIMIANEEATVSRYREVLDDVVEKLSMAKKEMIFS